MIVDSRPAAEFRQVRIPGSIHLPLRSLLARPYLKTRQLLLVDRGYLGAELESGCREFRSAGFTSVGIIEGGLNAWAQTMGDLEGDRAARSALNLIPARLFARHTTGALARPRRLGARFTRPGGARSRRRARPPGGDPAAFRRELGGAIRHARADRVPLFVAVVEVEGSRSAEVARALLVARRRARVLRRWRPRRVAAPSRQNDRTAPRQAHCSAVRSVVTLMPRTALALLLLLLAAHRARGEVVFD